MSLEQWEQYGEGGSLVRNALHMNRSVVGLHNPFDNGQPQPGPRDLAGFRMLYSIKLIEDLRQLFGSNSDPCVGNLDLYEIAHPLAVTVTFPPSGE